MAGKEGDATAGLDLAERRITGLTTGVIGALEADAAKHDGVPEAELCGRAEKAGKALLAVSRVFESLRRCARLAAAPAPPAARPAPPPAAAPAGDQDEDRTDDGEVEDDEGLDAVPAEYLQDDIRRHLLRFTHECVPGRLAGFGLVGGAAPGGVAVSVPLRAGAVAAAP